ncbi:HAMP domain-containing sensor histidine kinase [Catenovulum sediminis]|uniref:HAMP domain-containing sensor histidine kinase n=1 Tax=Catenovulum sediminis TaxID=1740262 RepID=UPI001FECF82B|nr:HAMP domain-containing sensor histidine kinase [Catenovulum sediminis]
MTDNTSNSSPQSLSSIKTNIVSMVLVISAVALIIAFVSNAYFEYKQQRSLLASESTAYTDIIGFSATSNLLFSDPSAESARLRNLSLIKNIENIHIYQHDLTTKNNEFFASYNKDNTPPVPNKLDVLQSFTEPNFSERHLEIIREIRFEERLLGYIYVRYSLSKQIEQFKNSLYLKITVFLITMCVASIIALKLQQKITVPIGKLVNLFKYASKDKDYTVRAPRQSLIELDGLSQSFNTMLDRFQAYLDKQAAAEKEIRKLNLNLEDKVGQRTDALKDANQELLSALETLHRYQNQLVENEKMASLGDMVAGIAHEVNTPIGLGVTASTLMLDRLHDIKGALNNKKLTAGQLERFLNEGEENLNIIYRNLNRAADLICSFKQVAVDQSNENTREFNVQGFLQDVLLSLRPKIKSTPHQIHVDCDEHLVIESKPGPLNQILINLIMNALIHAFKSDVVGNIYINLSAEDNNLHIVFKDDGVGVSEELKKRIFDPFVTTKRGEGGSGLGLHLVYNLVTQAFGGSITVDSQEGDGVTFNIKIPVNVKKIT